MPILLMFYLLFVDGDPISEVFGLTDIEALTFRAYDGIYDVS